jgi:hypothetical protein
MDYSKNLTSVGLNTLTFAAPAAGPFVLSGKISLPTISDDDVDSGGVTDGTSQVVVTVTQNSSTMYTGLPGAEGFRVNLSCAANDTLAVSFTSSAAIDQPINAVKASIGFSSGV